MILGIDVAKQKFDAALLLPGGKIKSGTFPNSPEGFSSLFSWLKKTGAVKVHACMEATGVYGHNLAKALAGSGHKVSVVNPARIKGFGQGELIRSKTDKADAALIARFCQAMRPEEWTAPPPHLERLCELSRRLDALNGALLRERNRLAVTRDEVVIESIQTMILHLRKEAARIKAAIRTHIENHPELRRQSDLLSSIPGVGPATITAILAELSPAGGFQSARKMAAFAGVTPRHHQSGSSVRGKSRMSKTGSGRIRKALYMPSLVAKRRNPILFEFAERLRAAGKPPMVVVGAVMRKLLHIIFGVLKSGKPFDPMIEINKMTAHVC